MALENCASHCSGNKSKQLTTDERNEILQLLLQQKIDNK